MTPSRIDSRAVRRITVIALLTAMALAAQWLESLLPPIVPAIPVRLGLANCFVLYALLALRRRTDALIVTVLRALLFVLVAGNASQVFYSLAGGLLSYAAMALLLPLQASGRISAIGLSVAGAFCFNVGQLAVGCLTAGPAMIAYLPWIGLLSIPAGIATGLLTALLIRRLPVR